MIIDDQMLAAYVYSIRPNEHTYSYECSSVVYTRVKLGIFGQTAKFEKRPCLIHISNIGMKNELTKQTVKILMRRLIRSRLMWIYTVCKCVSKFT